MKHNFPEWFHEFKRSSLFFSHDLLTRDKELQICQTTDLCALKNWIENLTADPYLRFLYGKKQVEKASGVFDAFDVQWGVTFGRFLKVSFNFFTFGTVEKIIEILRSNNAHNLIIDLRNCYGGELQACVDLLRMFVSNDDFLETKHRRRRTIYYSDKDSDICFDRVLIWVGKDTISTAEIFAHALRSKVRNCCIVGEETAGKKMGQTTFIDKRNKLYFTFSSFVWSIPGDSRSLSDYITADNDTDEKIEFYNTDDYYARSLQLVGLDWNQIRN